MIDIIDELLKKGVYSLASGKLFNIMKLFPLKYFIDLFHKFIFIDLIEINKDVILRIDG